MRLGTTGRINRDKPIWFEFDGQRYSGFEGDTLASALLANNVKLVGRSFKYHRPRGILTAGSEEPNALVTIGDEPNVRATTVELVDGLRAASQNRWPNLRVDMLSVNDLVSPFLSAGFYYKTFMWPKAFWEKVYEPFIRRAAGLGALTGEVSEEEFEQAYAFCDVLIIGGGPTGLMAALTAGRAGMDVILCDEDRALGGRLLSETAFVDTQSGADWAEDVEAELRGLPNVRVMTRTTVTGAYDQGTYGALERPATGPKECFWRIVAKDAILAAGALERPIAFPNNDRPGIMMASAVREYVNRYGVAPGEAVTVFGNNDDAHQTARDLIAAGVSVAGVIDTRNGIEINVDAPTFTGGQITATSGRFGLKSITVEHAGGTRQINTDCLAMSGGWNPTVHLTCHMNGRPQWREDIASFVPVPGMIPGLAAVGACNGDFDTVACLKAGMSAAVALGAKAIDLPEAEETPYNISPFWMVEGKGRKWLDFQNDVHVKDIRLAAQENFRSVEHMKRYTTQGMATDQGKSSNVAALAVLADATVRGIPETGTTTFRPPYVPVSIAAMGSSGYGHGFAPERHTTSHTATLARGAPMIEAGLWYRPSYFPQSGETTWRESCDREVRMVREAVGVCDVSTLGKIDVQGPDAPAFLDFAYTNTMSSVKVGRVRYGLMLREDGHVMDDGTAARLGSGHYVITTTTAAAGQVMTHLEFLRQTHCADLDVQISSATEQWAQFAVAGPKSRDLLNSLLDSPIDDGSMPYMSCGSAQVAGVDGRLFRISFSGEHAYEIAVPARFGGALFRLLSAQAESLGGGLYGMEALNVLRIEKGFITHAEIHGRTTAFDIGMDRMVRMEKDCVGQTAAQRSGLKDPNRERLVGLKAVDPGDEIFAGAHLFAEGDEALRENSAGYVTSCCFSPTLGGNIGLGFLKNGPERMGEVIVMVDHLRKTRTRCEVCSPVFIDPEGERLRG